MTLKSLTTRYVRLIRKSAVMCFGLLLATVSVLSLTQWTAEATGLNRRPAEADNSIPALQGAAAITYLKERKLYDSLRTALNAARTQRGDNSVLAPLFVHEQKLTSSDGAANDFFGSSIAVSGSTIVVGAPNDEIGGIFSQGSAYVFNRQGGSWVETQKLTASDGAVNDDFGSSVAISGSTIVVGARSDNIDGNANQGSVYVFNWHSSGWDETQKLTASDGAAGDFFGFSIAFSGSTIVVGAVVDDIGGNIDQGSAYVFNRQSGGWVETEKLTASDGAAGDQFGWSVAISGSTIVVGSPNDELGGNINQGSAYVFNRHGGSWLETQQLTGNAGASDDRFGRSVAISGSTIVVGVPNDDIVGGPVSQGSAHVFNRHRGSWLETQVLIASDGEANDGFGVSVAISGSTIVVGVPNDDFGGKLLQGSVYVFTRHGGSWLETQILTASDGAVIDFFGQPVAISGSTIVVRASSDIDGHIDQGAAYVFEP